MYVKYGWTILLDIWVIIHKGLEACRLETSGNCIDGLLEYKVISPGQANHEAFMAVETGTKNACD